MVAPCGTPVVGNRRTFWTWQPCRTYVDECGNECAKWGLELYCPDKPDHCTDEHMPGDQRSIKTNDWLRSLIISILFTNGRRADTECGWRPGTRGGHWSDSYRPNDYPGTAGSLVRDLKPHGRISDAIQELRAILTHDLQKLVTYGVATKVEVEVSVKNSTTAYVNIIVYGQGTDTAMRVGLSVQRIRNAWVWDT